MLRDATQLACFELFNELGIEYTFHGSRNQLTFKRNGASILFRSLDNPERLRGTNLAWVGIDELTYCKRDSWQRLQARVRDPKAKALRMFGCWTPNGYDWVWDDLVNKSGQDGIEVILATPGENTFLPGNYYSGLENDYDEKFYQQEVLGEYLSVTGGRAYRAFDRNVNVKPLMYNPRTRLLWSLDFNNNPMCSVIAQVEDFAPNYLVSSQRTRELRVLDEIYIEDGTVDLACAAFQQRADKYLGRGFRLEVGVYGDAAGNNRSHAGTTDYQLIKSYFARDSRFVLVMKVPSANPPIKDRVNAVNALLKNAAGDIRCFLDPGCSELMKDLEQVSWKEDKAGNSTGELDKAKDSKRTHVSDALGYLIWEEFPIRGRQSVIGTERLV